MYNPQDAYRQESSAQLEHLRQVGIPLAILGSTMLVIGAFLLYSYLPGDKAQIARLSAQVQQSKSTIATLESTVKEQQALISAQTAALRRATEERKQAEETLDSIRQLLNQEYSNDRNSHSTRSNPN